jgi:poly-gamma-glutamate synthesis protein (capsule biosynthesis protein)
MINILVAGDLFPNDRVYDLIETCNFETVFGDIKQEVADNDYTIVNFEGTIIYDENTEGIEKCGPNLRITERTLEAIKYAGFKGVTLANNHFSDFGDKGVANTIESLEKFGIDYVGGGYNLENASKVLYKKIKGKTIAFVNLCENEFTVASIRNGGSNPLDTVHNYYQITEAKKISDFVIVITHGGPEHYQYPTPRMQKIYRFFVDIGADIIINHHQHCFSGYESFNKGLIFYGIGNFSFDFPSRRQEKWNQGFMVKIIIDENDNINKTINFKLLPYLQGDIYPGIKLMDDKDKNYFFEEVTKINLLIKDTIQLNKLYEMFIEDTKNEYLSVLKPLYSRRVQKIINNKLFPASLRKKFFPEYLTKNRILHLISFFQCESHQDRILNLLKKLK